MSQKTSQLPYFFGVLSIVLIAMMGLLSLGVKYSLIWILGILLGFALQRSRFCFTAAFRDIALFGSTSAARGVLLILFITTIGFGLIQKQAFDLGLSIPGNIDPVGLPTIVGGILFGIGMVIAGGCVSGTLMRMGEGYLMQWIVFFNLIIGLLMAAYSLDWWYQYRGPVIHFPSILGYGPAIIMQLSMIALLYYLAYRWENR